MRSQILESIEQAIPRRTVILGLAIFAVLLVYTVGYQAAVGRQEGQVERINHRLDSLEASTSQGFERLEQQVTTATPPVWLDSRARRRLWASMPTRGGQWTARIDAWLAGTPAAGKGRQFVIAAYDNGLDPRLSVAIAYHESGGFTATPPGSNNYGGMKYGNRWLARYGSASGRGPDGTHLYQRFPDMDTFVAEHATFIRRMWGPVSSPYQMAGYAESSDWAANVAANMARI